MGLIVCPSCNHQRESKKVSRASYVCSNCGCTSPRLITRMKVWIDGGDKAGIDPELARQQTYSGLLWFAQSRGYKQGWVGMKYRTLFGSWPPDEYSSLEAETPSQELMLWERKQKALWARERKEKDKTNGNGHAQDTEAILWE